MPYKRIFKGKPYTFQEFLFFSPNQFDKLVDIEEKDFIYKLKICTNSGRIFTGPFFNDVVGEYEITNKELKEILEMVNDTPGMIIYGVEYTINDDFNGLWKYYGTEKDRPLAYIDQNELLAQ